MEEGLEGLGTGFGRVEPEGGVDGLWRIGMGIKEGIVDDLLVFLLGELQASGGADPVRFGILLLLVGRLSCVSCCV